MNGEDFMNKKKLGKKNLLPEKVEPKDVKVLISIRLTEDVLDYFKTIADQQGVGYQMLIQQALNERMKDGSLASRVEKLEHRIPVLEKALLKTG